MDRKKMRVLVLICTLAVLLAQPVTASAASYTPYAGPVPEEYREVFGSIAGKISFREDYVFFRSAENEYMMITGDLTYESGSFEAETCTVYRILFQDGAPSFSQREEFDLVLTVNDALVFSDLGYFPDLIDRSEVYSLATLFLLVIALCMYLINGIFNGHRR